MKAFLSPVYFQTNAASDEKITAGLIIVTPVKIWFHFSSFKLSLLKKLHSIDAYYNADNSLNSLENKIVQSNVELESAIPTFFKSDLPFNIEYFSYLSKYSSGLVQFGSPKPINSEINESTFASYYKIFVGESLILNKEKIHKTLFATQLKEHLKKPGLSEKADINFKLTPAIIPGLIKEADITLISKNGSINAFQGVDFSLSPKSIVDNLYEFEVLVNSLKKFSHLNKINSGNYSIVTIEPSSTASEQHKLFDHVQSFKSDDYKLIDPSQFDTFTDKIVKSNYSKFSTYLASC